MTASSRFWLCAVLIGTTMSAQGAGVPLIPAEKLALLPVTGKSPEDLEIKNWQDRARDPKATLSHFERLGWAFVAKARATQDPGFYKMAEATADVMDTRFGLSPDSKLLRGHVLHNLHRFAEAEAVARSLVAERGLAWDRSLLSDVLMEQGKIDEAIAECQRAMNLRPGAEAYARAAHFRWLKGDLPGATAMMGQALQATSSRQGEIYAWSLVRLSGYRLQQGVAGEAQQLAEKAVSLAPDYAPAMLAMARARLAQGDAAGSVDLLKRAADLNPLPEYRWWLADALRAVGKASEATAVEALLIQQGEAGDPRTLALFLATRGLNPLRAIELAQGELKNREDVFTLDALAWAYLGAGKVEEAKALSARSLVENTQDARLFLHAGTIAARAGDSAQATTYFQKALPLAGSLTPSERSQLLSISSTRVTDSSPTGTPLLSPK